MRLLPPDGTDGNDMDGADPDYAVALFNQLLTVQPDNVKARQELRGIERKQVDDLGGRTLAMATGAWLKGIIPLLKIGLWLWSKSYERTMIECERFLRHDPYSAPVLRALAKAARESGYIATAAYGEQDLAELRDRPKR